MANLSEVKTALKQGDKQKASQLLKAVLQERPSADAWYMAAQMSGSKETASKHLQRALSMDSRHTKSRDMLRELGGEQKAASHNLVEEIRTEIENFGENNRLLARFSPKQRLLLAGGTALSVLVLIIALIGSIGRGQQPGRAIAAAPSVSVVQSDTLISHFESSGLSIDSIEKITPDATLPVGEHLALEVQDAAGSHPVTIYLYRSVDDLVKDNRRLASLAETSGVTVYQTAVMFYPADLDSTTTIALESVFESAPIS